MLAFGDSITQGTGAAQGEDWPMLLAVPAPSLLAAVASQLRIPLMADSDSIVIADSVPGDGGHLARAS